MNYTFLPDLFALAILIAILLQVRRRHSDARANAWLLGLFITLVEGIAHIFYAPKGVPSSILHLIVVECYVLAGLVFVYAAGNQKRASRDRMLFLTLNAIPLMALAAPYGLNLRLAPVYIPAIAGGILIGVATSLAMRGNWRYALLYIAGWSIVGVLVAEGRYRQAVYWTIASIYALAGVNFQRRLARRSTGRLAIVTGFLIWAMFFFFHPWIVNHPAVTDVASHMWNLQKALISIGMILVMLEGQVASNEFLALHDELTGLPNRRMFASKLTAAIEHSDRRSSSLALVVVDLNGFKAINDSLGHLAGDSVLREVATTLRKNVRASDTVARLGGDEFIIVASDMANEHSVQRFADSLRAAIERPMLIQGVSMSVTASLGIAMYPEDARDATKLLRLADQRMYAGKTYPIRVTKIDTGRHKLAPPA